jgi:hypothetical protein
MTPAAAVVTVLALMLVRVPMQAMRVEAMRVAPPGANRYLVERDYQQED